MIIRGHTTFKYFISRLRIWTVKRETRYVHATRRPLLQEFPRSQIHVQGSPKECFLGLVNFVTAVAYHFCLKLPRAFLQPGKHSYGDSCSIKTLSVFIRSSSFGICISTGLPHICSPICIAWKYPNSSFCLHCVIGGRQFFGGSSQSHLSQQQPFPQQHLSNSPSSLFE